MINDWKLNVVVGRPHLDDRDIIRRLDGSTTHIVEQIFSYLDYDSLVNAEKVSPEWQEILKNERIWKMMFKRNVVHDAMWRTFFNQVKRTPGYSPTDDDGFMTRRVCKEVANLRQQYIALMSSAVSLLSSSVKLISKVLDMFRLVGFGESMYIPESDDSDDD